MATLVINYSETVSEELLFAPVFHRLKRDAGWCWLDASGGTPPSENTLQSLWLSLGPRPLRLILLIDPDSVASPPRPLDESWVASCWVVLVDLVRGRLGPAGITAGGGEGSRPGVAVKPYQHGGVLRFPWPIDPRDQVMQLSYLLVLLAQEDVPEAAAFARVEMELDHNVLHRHLNALGSRFSRAIEVLAEGKDTFTLELLQEPSLDGGEHYSKSGEVLTRLSFGLLWRPSDRNNWDRWLASAEYSLRERRSAFEKELVDCANNLHTLTPESRQEIFSIATLSEKEGELQRHLEALQQSWQRPGLLPDFPSDQALWSDLAREYTSRFEEASQRKPSLKVALLAGGVALLLLFSSYAGGVSAPPSQVFTVPLLLLMLSLFAIWAGLHLQRKKLQGVVEFVQDKFSEQVNRLNKVSDEQKKAMKVIAKIRTIQRNMAVLRDKRKDLDRAKRLKGFHRELFQQRLRQVVELLGSQHADQDDPGRIEIDPFRREIVNACYDGATDAPQTFIFSVPGERVEEKRASPLCPGLTRVTFTPRKPDELFGTSPA